MPGLSAGGEPDRHQWALERLQQGQHLLIAISPAAPIAPTKPHRCFGLLRQIPEAPAQPTIGLLPHRIGAAAQHGRGGSHAGEQIEHLKPSEPPSAGKPLQAPEGGVIAISRGA
jgi:hypothetical protein